MSDKLTQLRAERQTGLGGSDMIHLFELEPYGCHRRLLYEKTGTPPDHPFVGNSATDRGARLEEFIVKEYTLATGRQVRRVGVRRHKEHEHLLVHVDRMIVNDQRGPGYLEVKCPGRESYYQQKRKGLADGYILQMQHGLLVTGWTWGSFALLNPENWEMLTFDVDADTVLQAEIMAKAHSAWEAKEKGLLSKRLPLNSRACDRCPWRTTCQGQAILEDIEKHKQAVGAAAGLAAVAGVPYESDGLDPDLQDTVDTFLEAREFHKEAESLFDEAKKQLSAQMGGREEARVIGARVYYRPNTTNRVDSNALKREQPKIYEQYVRESVTRPLKVFKL